MEGLITLIAAVAAAAGTIWLGVINTIEVRALQEQVKVGQAQVKIGQEQIDSQQRPVLVPGAAPPFFDKDHDEWLKWDAPQQPLILNNVGTGTAFNVASVLYGCTAYLHDGPTGPILSPAVNNPHWIRWLGVPIAAGAEIPAPLTLGASTFLQGNDHIGGYSFHAPAQPSMAAIATQGVLWAVARLTITYHDISGRKYASIFDYVRARGWYKVDIIPGIDRDIDDLEGYYRAVPELQTPADQAGVTVEEVEKQVEYFQARQPNAALYDRDREQEP